MPECPPKVLAVLFGYSSGIYTGMKTMSNISAGVMFGFHFKCGRIAQAETCAVQREVADIPPPPLDLQTN
jgi:hypothetical protein